MAENQGRVALCPHSLGEASGALKSRLPEWVLQPVSLRPISARVPLPGQGPPAYPQAMASFPRRPSGAANHYLGQVLLEGLQGEDHGGSYSPVIMPGETE